MITGVELSQRLEGVLATSHPSVAPLCQPSACYTFSAHISNIPSINIDGATIAEVE